MKVRSENDKMVWASITFQNPNFFVSGFEQIWLLDIWCSNIYSPISKHFICEASNTRHLMLKISAKNEQNIKLTYNFSTKI